MCLDKAVGRLSRPIADVLHGLAYRAGVCISFAVVMQVVRVKRILSVFAVSDLLVEVAIFDERRDAFLFQKVVVLFAPVSGVRSQALGYFSVAFDRVLDMIF